MPEYSSLDQHVADRRLALKVGLGLKKSLKTTF